MFCCGLYVLGVFWFGLINFDSVQEKVDFVY